MVLDDEPDIIATIKMSLEICKESGFVIETFTNPFIALEKFNANPSAYTMVLTDIRMPNMNGFQFARYVKDKRGDIPILFMTAFVIDENLPGFEALWTKGIIIRKPEGLLDLCKVLHDQLPKISA